MAIRTARYLAILAALTAVFAAAPTAAGQEVRSKRGAYESPRFIHAVLEEIVSEEIAKLDSSDAAYDPNAAAELYAKRGTHRFWIGEYDGARDDLNRALDGDHLSATMRESAIELRLALRAGSEEKSSLIDDMTALIEFNKSADRYAMRALWRSQVGEPPAAEADYTRAIELSDATDWTSMFFFRRRAEVRIGLRDFDGAAADFSAFFAAADAAGFGDDEIGEPGKAGIAERITRWLDREDDSPPLDDSDFRAYLTACVEDPDCSL